MPRLGEGVFIIKDVARILRLDYDKVRRWILGYWDHALKEDCNYTFGDKGSKAINFLSLIEFYTFFKLREKGVSAAQIHNLHEELSANWIRSILSQSVKIFSWKTGNGKSWCL